MAAAALQLGDPLAADAAARLASGLAARVSALGDLPSHQATTFVTVLARSIHLPGLVSVVGLVPCSLACCSAGVHPARPTAWWPSARLRTWLT